MSLRWKARKFFTPHLRTLYEWLVIPPAPNDIGTRDVEYSFIAANMPKGPGKALDFGCGNSWMPLLAARKGFHIKAVDLKEPAWNFKHNNLEFELSRTIPNTSQLDLIVNCSVVEHLGLGRYGLKEDSNADLEVMDLSKHILTETGTMLLTTQVGRDKIIPGVHRIYGAERLPKLLEGWTILKIEYWIKRLDNKWEETDRSKALEVEGNENYYALGLFVLGK